jgi:hypothetical protein
VSDPAEYADDQYARWLYDHDLDILELDILNNEPKGDDE